VKGRIERLKPSTAQGRERKTELKKLIRDSRTSRADRERYRLELDEVSPPANPAERFVPKILNGSADDIREPKPTNADLQALIDRVEAKHANGSSPDASGPSGELARQLDAAKRTIEPQLKAKTLHIDDALCTIAEAHAKFGYEIWTGRGDWEDIPRDGKAAIVTCQLKHWRGEPVFEHPTWGGAAWGYFMQLPAVEKLKARGAFEQFKENSTPESRKKIFEHLKIAERMNEPVPEKYRTEPPTALPQAEPEAPNPAPMRTEPEPRLGPVEQAGVDLATRAALVLATDSWLSRLSLHSDEMRNRIIAALSDELLKSGCVSGDFCTKLYNQTRPRAVSQFPERKF